MFDKLFPLKMHAKFLEMTHKTMALSILRIT